MQIITFKVYGTPKPAGSKRAFPIRRGGVFTGRVAVVDDCAKSRDWKQQVSSAAAQAMSGIVTGLIEGPLKLKVSFYLSRPIGHFRTGAHAGTLRQSAPRWPAVRPDLTKLVRAVEDAMLHVVYRDDAQIVCQEIAKRYASSQTYVEIEVSSIPEIL